MTKNYVDGFTTASKRVSHPMVEYICNLYEQTKQQEEVDPLSDQQRMQRYSADESTNVSIREVGTQMFKM